MLSYLKKMVVGEPQAPAHNLQKDDISLIIGSDELIDLLATELPGSFTLYDVKPGKVGGIFQQRKAM
jgi:hypothetical protein